MGVVTPTSMRTRFNEIINYYGQTSRFQYFTRTNSGADYDNEYITTSGTIQWYPILNFPVGKNSTDRDYLEQGAIIMDDQVVYLAGSIELNAFTKIGLGSPSTGQYAIVAPAGIQTEQISGTTIYQKAYIRRLNNGSFIGEY